jgi:hypothetical protein
VEVEPMVEVEVEGRDDVFGVCSRKELWSLEIGKDVQNKGNCLFWMSSEVGNDPISSGERLELWLTARLPRLFSEYVWKPI